MSLIIRIEDNDEVHVSLSAASINAAIALIDRTRRALCELDDHTPTPPLDPSRFTDAELPALLDCLHPVPADAPASASSDLVLPPTQDDQPATSANGPELLATTQPAQLSNPVALNPAAALAAIPDAPPTLAQLRAEIATTGGQLFGEAWSSAAGWLTTIWTTKYTPGQVRDAIALLTYDECQAILLGLIDHAPSVQAEWRKHLQSEVHKSPAAPTPKAASRQAAPHGRRPSQTGHSQTAAAPGNVVMATG